MCIYRISNLKMTVVSEAEAARRVRREGTTMGGFRHSTLSICFSHLFCVRDAFKCVHELELWGNLICLKLRNLCFLAGVELFFLCFQLCIVYVESALLDIIINLVKDMK